MYIQLFSLFFLLHYIESKDLSCNDIRAFVDGHNNRRLLVAEGKVPGQPAASEMRSVIWDNELATNAQKWASQNKVSHNPDRSVGSGRFVSVGENIYVTYFSNKNRSLKVDDALAAWFKEYKNYKYGPFSKADSFFNLPIGHYTQMVWSNSTYLGCGVSRILKKGVKYYVVCNYGPSGNVLGQKPYKEGGPSNKLVCSASCNQPYGDKC